MKRIGTDKENQGDDFTEEIIIINETETEDEDDAADDTQGRQ